MANWVALLGCAFAGAFLLGMSTLGRAMLRASKNREISNFHVLDILLSSLVLATGALGATICFAAWVILERLTEGG